MHVIFDVVKLNYDGLNCKIWKS